MAAAVVFDVRFATSESVEELSKITSVAAMVPFPPVTVSLPDVRTRTSAVALLVSDLV